MPEFRPKKKILPKAKEWIIKRLTDSGNPYTKPKPVIELNKAFSVVMDQKLYSNKAQKLLRSRVALKEAGSNPIKAAATGILSKYNKAKASVLEGVAQTTGLPSITRKAKRARSLSLPENSAKVINKKHQNINKKVENTKKTAYNTADALYNRTGDTIINSVGKAGGAVVARPGLVIKNAALQAGAKVGQPALAIALPVDPATKGIIASAPVLSKWEFDAGVDLINAARGKGLNPSQKARYDWFKNGTENVLGPVIGGDSIHGTVNSVRNTFRRVVPRPQLQPAH